MKVGVSIPGILLIVCMAFPVSSQEPVIVLRHKELGKHERPAVEFNHESHAQKIDCLQCHHDYDAYLNNRGGEGQPCGTCHGLKAVQDTVSLRDAFHLQCKGCHEFMRAQGKPGGPRACGECHVRRK